MTKKNRRPRRNIGNNGPVGRRAAQLGQDPETAVAAEAASRGEYRSDIGRSQRPAEIPVAFVRDPAAFTRGADALARNLEAEQPGLMERLGRGLSPDELSDPGTLQAIARATAGAGPGRYSVVQGGASETMPAKLITGGGRTDGGDGLPGGLQPGDIFAPRRPAGYRSAGIPLPDGYAGDPGDRVWRPVAAAPEGGPELIVTDDLDSADLAGTDLVIEDLDPDDEQDSGRVLMGSPAAVRGWHNRMEAADRRAAKLIAGARDTSALARTREEADAIGLREQWTAAQVLAAHEWLHKHYQSPPDDIADYLAFHIRNSLEQDHHTASMFWPLDLTRGADIPEGTQLARLIARGLGDARTFQVTPAMCRNMRAEWDAEPAQELVLDQGRLPVPAGFAWLDAPWVMELSAGYWLPVRAVSWERIPVHATSTAGLYGITAGGPGTVIDAVRTVLWLRIPDDVAFGRWKGGEKRAVKVANQIGNLLPQQVCVLPFGVRVNTEGEFHTNGKSLLGLLHTLWRTLGETLPKSRPVRASLPGGPRQAARRSLKHDHVHVITLREYTYDNDPEARHPQQGNWSCRWWVDEFYRHIDAYSDADEAGVPRRHKAVPASQPGLLPDDDHDVCAVCLAHGQTIRVSYVAGFTKGPPGLPFRTPASDRTVYRLAR